MPRAVVVLRPQARSAGKAIPLAAGHKAIVAVGGPRGRAVGAALAGNLGARVPCDVVEIGSVADTAQLPTDLVGALLDLRALDAPSELAGALSSAKTSLFLAQRLRPALLESARAGGACYVVVTSLEGSAHPATAAVHGLLKTAALEWPEVACAVLDVHPAVDAAQAVAEELSCGFMDLEVVRSAEGRLVPEVVERPASAESRAPLNGGVWVASGGARGVTATTLLALARASCPALLLLGRTALEAEPACCARALDEPSLKRALVEDAKAHGRPVQLAAIGEEARRVLAVREIAAFVASLEAAGARVLYRAVDVRDVEAVRTACAEARALFGPITGLVHGAGVLADKRIEDKTVEQVDRVMDTKVLGLEALLTATHDEPLTAVALFSSVAGRFGNVGQVDYSMANEALNEMAVRLQRERPGCVVKALNWGPWEGGMVTPALKKVFEERGVRVLSHADGARHFVDELGAGNAHVEVVFGGELAASSRDAGGRSFHIAQDAWGFLEDHSVKGTPVLPVVGALELFARATSARVLTQVRVLRGVKLPQLAHGGHALDVERDGAALTLRVVGEKAPSYAASVAPPSAPLALEAPAGLSPWDRASPYSGALFHGSRFHLVDAVEGVGRAGLVARVRGCQGRGWGEDLATDMGALDAALQAALLWTRHATGGAFLPTGIARAHLVEPVTGALRCVLVARSLDDTRGVCDVALFDMSGRAVASLEGVEVHRLGDDAAFGNPGPAATGQAVQETSA